MFCNKCGTQVPEGSKFCNKCGSSVSPASLAPDSAPPPGTALKGGTVFCSKCGTQVPEGSKFCNKCGSSVSPASLAPDSAPPPGTAFGRYLSRQGISHVISSLVAAGGAILMLIALAVPWYTMRADGSTVDISRGDLLSPGEYGPNWAGSGLPIVIIIICASVSLLSVGYAVMTGSQQKKLWAWLGSLSIGCALANLGYILWWTMHTANDMYYGEVSAYTTPHAGFFLAFFGAIALVVSSCYGQTASGGSGAATPSQ